MTVVAAVARAGTVTMAADTCTNYAGTHVLGARKIARLKIGDDDALIAATGTGALIGLPAHWESPAAPDPDNVDSVQAWAFEASRALCEIAAAQQPPLLAAGHDGSEHLNGAFLLGWRGRLIYLFTHQAVVLDDGIAALGVGSDYAFGYIEATIAAGTLALNAPPHGRELVAAAVTGACQRYDGCRVGPDGPQVEQLGNSSWR